MVKVIETKEDLNEETSKAAGKLIVIDFHAAWCGPCKMIAPYIEELSNTYSDVVFLKADVDEAEDLAEEFDISSMPTFKFCKNGKEIGEVIGANKDNLKAKIDQLK